MKLNKKIIGLGLVAVAALGLAACARGGRGGSSADSKVKAAIVTDTGGVDDKSFNQSAWEGLQEWGKANKLKKDSGFTYFQSNSESDFANNMSAAQSQGYNLIFGVGFALHDAVSDAAKEHEDVNYVIIDDVIKDQKNVESVLFADFGEPFLTMRSPMRKYLHQQVSQQQCNQKQIKLVSLVVKHQIQLHVLKLVSQQVLNL